MLCLMAHVPFLRIDRVMDFFLNKHSYFNYALLYDDVRLKYANAYTR